MSVDDNKGLIYCSRAAAAVSSVQMNEQVEWSERTKTGKDKQINVHSMCFFKCLCLCVAATRCNTILKVSIFFLECGSCYSDPVGWTLKHIVQPIAFFAGAVRANKIIQSQFVYRFHLLDPATAIPLPIFTVELSWKAEKIGNMYITYLLSLVTMMVLDWLCCNSCTEECPSSIGP